MSKKSLIICVIFFLIYVISAFAQEESITITTYYPSPYGSYNELRAKKMGIGDTYYQAVPIPDPADLIVEGSVGIGRNAAGAKLDVFKRETDKHWVAIAASADAYNKDRAIGVSGSALLGTADWPTDNTYKWNIGVAGSGSDGIGVYGSGKAGVYGIGDQGVKGVSSADCKIGCKGVHAEGKHFGVYATSSEGDGVYAEGDAYGVYSKSKETGVYGEGKYGVYGKLASGGTAAIYGDAGGGPTATAGHFDGNVYITGSLSLPSTSMIVTGGLAAAGNITATGTITSYAPDLAEYFSTAPAEPGDVMVIDKNTNQRLVRSTQPYDYRVAGIVSANPGFVLGKEAEGKKLVALLGQVECKATVENGSIVPGDLLVTSSKPGYVMRADMEKLKPGMTVGKALEPLKKGEGKILVLVTLQ